jgi:hypothetical protein
MSGARLCGPRAGQRLRILRSTARWKALLLCEPRRLPFPRTINRPNRNNRRAQYDAHARTTEPQITQTVDCASRGIFRVSMISLKNNGTWTFSSYTIIAFISKVHASGLRCDEPCHR